LSKKMTPAFMRYFIEAFMSAQGVTEKEIASIEADFPKKSK